MKEQLYTIPVHDAFSTKCECPLCAMHRDLEKNAIAYTMGPSYMEDDNRALTDAMGFCSKHIHDLYQEKNRLGLALMLNTHMDKLLRDLKACAEKGEAPSRFFKKSADKAPVVEYITRCNQQCFICQRIDQTFERYLDTIFHLWKKEPDFAETFKACNGFCLTHYGRLYEAASLHLSGNIYDAFIDALNTSFFQNLERVNEDVSWFINKFDYRYQNEPWKNAKDALARAVTKVNSLLEEES